MFLMASCIKICLKENRQSVVNNFFIGAIKIDWSVMKVTKYIQILCLLELNMYYEMMKNKCLI